MSDRRTKRKSHPLRTAFRWFRIVVLLILALVVGAILWSNIFGLPGFVEAAIRNEVRRRGIELNFTKLRLKGFRHLVARDVRFTSESTNAPLFTVREAEFIVDYQRLKSGHFEVSGIRLNSGHLTLPLEGGVGKSLIVSNINTDVFFVPGDVVRVMGFSAEALGAKAQVTGELKHLWKFKFAAADAKNGTNAWQRHLLDVVEIAEQLEFKKPPELKISLHADGADLANMRATVMVTSEEATSRWGTFDRLQISSSIAPTASNSVRGDFLSEISGVRTHFGVVQSLRLEGETYWASSMERMITNSVRLTSGGVDARWFRFNNAVATLASSQESSNVPIRSTIFLATGPIESSGARIQTNTLTAELSHPLPFRTPASWLAKFMSRSGPQAAPANELSGSWKVESAGVAAGGAQIDTVQLWGELRSDNAQNNAKRPLLARVKTPWQMVATNIRAGEISLGSVQSGGEWNFPDFTVTNLSAELYGGYLKAVAELNVESGMIGAWTESAFPYEKLSTLLDKPVQKWFEQFAWKKPPYVESRIALKLPPWTNQWRMADVVRQLQVAGRFDASGAFRGVNADRAESHFVFTNFIWQLPDLTITRPEGRALLNYSGNVMDGDFHCTIDSRIDPGVLKSAFPREQQVALGVVKFVEPPYLVGEASGNWDDPARLTVNARISATNFFVKEQAFSDLRADIRITNALIHCSNIVVHRGSEEVVAPYLRVDLPGEVMFVTNLVSNMDPYIAMSLIGEEAYDAIDPYRFAQKPTVRVNGVVPLRHWSKADLRFEVAGDEFTFWRFRIPRIAGIVHWKADHISFSNVTANFYGGKAQWSGYFVIDHSDDSANYSFAAQTTNSELKYLVGDLTGQTNQIEGTLDGELIITSANSSDERSWNGYGKATMTDGFLWNVPIFGIFSPILDGIAPGLGSSRIKSGSGTFTITNSVVYTRDMQVRAPAFRLGYKGQVDLDGRLEAVVEAQIFRDAWVVGKLFSIALWPVSKAFEARVSGTIDAPKTDLRFVPKFLLAPFRALNAFGDGGGRKSDQSALPPAERAN